MRTYDLGKAMCKAVAGCMGFGRWANGGAGENPGLVGEMHLRG